MKRTRVSEVNQLVTWVCLLFTLFPNLSHSAPLVYEIIDVYSSINVSYALANGSDSGSLYEEVHGAQSTSLSRTFDLGLLSGSQNGSIAADPTAGTVRATGSSSTLLTSLNTGTGAGYEPNYFASWGKHVVIGRFEVPNIGQEFTDIYFERTVHQTVDGQALFLIDEADKWNPDQLKADGYTPWGGFSESGVFSFLYRPGTVVYFAFGIEPGIGGSGRYINGLTNADAIDVTFSLTSDASMRSIPEPNVISLVGLAICSGIYVMRRNRRP